MKNTKIKVMTTWSPSERLARLMRVTGDVGETSYKFTVGLEVAPCDWRVGAALSDDGHGCEGWILRLSVPLLRLRLHFRVSKGGAFA